MKSFIVLLLETVAVAQTVNMSGTTVINGISGAPYSALEVTENVQTLADGTHITQQAGKVQYYRDSQGRTRTERTFPPPPGAAGGDAGPSMIEIHDPVAGVQCSLDVRNRKAREVPSARVIRDLPPAQPTGKPLAANRTTTFVPNDQRQRPEISHESLGTQMIEGVSAEGSRTTTVYPVGFFGNDRPITTVSETWTSPDLKLTVLSKNSDPRSGERTTRLTNISRAEPDPTLFQVPANYEIVDSMTPRVSH